MTALRPLLGLLLAGYGGLVLVGVLAHDSPWAGGLSLLAGLALLVGAVPRLVLRRASIVAALGAVIVVGVVGYNLANRSDLSAPEWAILVYGASLLAAAPFLSFQLRRVDVGTLVAWSFPLVLAPLGLFAVNGAVSSAQTGTAAAPLVVLLIVHPTAFGLRLLGTPFDMVGSSLVVTTERGLLSLDVGLVCAGLYPMVLFGGIVALHAWRERMPMAATIKLVAAGLLGLWIVNLLRLVALAKIGARWGPDALQQAHANLGWLLFAAFMVAFWAVALRGRGSPPRPIDAPPEANPVPEPV